MRIRLIIVSDRTQFRTIGEDMAEGARLGNN